MNVEGQLKRHETIKDYLEYESMILADEIISNRIRLKILNNEKINVLLICHRPTVWNTLKSIYQALKKDDLFDVKILAIPNKKQLPGKGLGHEVYESEGAETFWRKDDCINGYNYETGEWVDPRSLKPDYVFFQQPYNVCRSYLYKSWIVSKYARICYLSYGYQIAGADIFESVYPMDFMKSVKFIFSSDKLDTRDIKEWFKKNQCKYPKVLMSGNPRFDLIKKDSGQIRRGVYTALWTPRWSTGENNCFFFDFKDTLLRYCDEHDDFSLIFRPHPQMFLEFAATGEMSENEAVSYKNEYVMRKNARMDVNEDYLGTFAEVDCFITDMTSLMAEYLLTGKPVIYCHKTDCFTVAGREIAQGFYWVRNIDELKDTLDMLKSGTDPLAIKREKIVNKIFYRPHGGAGQCIKNIIKEDAFGYFFEK